MSATAATSMLNYNDHRQKAMSASYERVKVPPQNGTVFEMGNTIDIRLPNMPMGSFLDFHNSYLKLNIETVKADGGGTPAAADDLWLPRNGVYGGLIQRVEIISSAQTISVIDQYSKLANIFLDSEAGIDFKDGIGSIQYGMQTGDEYGAALTPTGTATDDHGTQNNFFCFGLILTNLMSSSKYLPLFSADNIIIRLTLNSKAKAFIGTNGGASTVKVRNVEFVNYVVKLDPVASKLVDDAVGGRYSVVLDDWRNSRGTIPSASQTINQNLGLSVASLSRVLFAFYRTNYSNSGVASDVEGSRSHRFVSEYSFQLNGQNYPAQRIKADASSNMSEVMAEIRGSTRQSLDFDQGSDLTLTDFQLNNASGTGSSIGKAFYEIDLESLRQYDSENSVYSGLYTIGGVTSLDCQMSGAGGSDMDLNVWGQFQATLSLDTRGDNIFTYQV